MIKTKLKLKTILESILVEEERRPTWGEVLKIFKDLKQAQTKGIIKQAAVSSGKTALNLIPGLNFVETALNAVQAINDVSDLTKVLIKLGKNLSDMELKHPRDDKFKKMTGPFWNAIKLSQEVSIILDDDIEAQFINKVIVPELSKSENIDIPIPNMDELLGKWLNDYGLKQNADIYFRGRNNEL